MAAGKARIGGACPSVGLPARTRFHRSNIEEDFITRAALFNGPKNISVDERPDPVIQEPTDAVVRVVLACVCGSDLWYYRGESEHAIRSIGHEFGLGLDRPRAHVPRGGVDVRRLDGVRV